MPRQTHHLGWHPDHPDFRDYTFTANPAIVQALPSKVDLSPQCPPVYDQGRIGSCTANAIAAAVQFDRLKTKQSPDFVPSRLFVYYNERKIEGSVKYDSGAQIRDGIKSVATQGVCSETEWPYDDTPPKKDGGAFPAGARDGKLPTAQCYKDALKTKVVSYHSVNQTLADLQGCLAEGYPIVFGFTVYSSWQDPVTGWKTNVPMPSAHDTVLGGHAVLCVGYDQATQMFKFRNSWGPSIGEKGYFYMPFAFLTNPKLCQDFWTVRTTTA